MIAEIRMELEELKLFTEHRLPRMRVYGSSKKDDSVIVTCDGNGVVLDIKTKGNDFNKSKAAIIDAVNNAKERAVKTKIRELKKYENFLQANR